MIAPRVGRRRDRRRDRARGSSTACSAPLCLGDRHRPGAARGGAAPRSGRARSCRSPRGHVLRAVAAAVAAPVRRRSPSRSRKLTQPHSLEPFLGTITNHPGRALLRRLPAVDAAGRRARGRRRVGACARARERTRDRAARARCGSWSRSASRLAGPPGWRALRDAVRRRARADGGGRLGLRRDQARARACRRRSSARGRDRRSTSAITLVPRPPVLPRLLRRAGRRRRHASRAHGWLETAWWGEGVASAVDYVNEHAAPGARVFRDCIEPAHLAWFREDLWTPMARDPKEADWIVAYSPSSHGARSRPTRARSTRSPWTAWCSPRSTSGRDAAVTRRSTLDAGGPRGGQRAAPSFATAAMA